VPAVSVIIPTHNRATLVERAVHSARAAGDNVEIIVVDDASIDETESVCRKLGNIRYIRFEHGRGQSEARNAGIAESRADYVAFLDDDDLLLPGALELQRQDLAAETDAGFIYGCAKLATQTGELTGSVHPVEYPDGDIFWQILSGFCPCPNSLLFRKSCFARAGYFDAAYQPVEDWDLWIRVSEQFKAVARRRAVGVYRCATPDSGQNTSSILNIASASMRAQRRGFALARARAASAAARRAAHRRLRHSYSDKLVWNAADSIASGSRQRARCDLVAALRYAPFRAARPWTLKLLLASLVPTFAGRGGI
jgi:glycosyltransferase involved in cell wall biosynthesis